MFWFVYSLAVTGADKEARHLAFNGVGLMAPPPVEMVMPNEMELLPFELKVRAHTQTRTHLSALDICTVCLAG